MRTWWEKNRVVCILRYILVLFKFWAFFLGIKNKKVVVVSLVSCDYVEEQYNLYIIFMVQQCF